MRHRGLHGMRVCVGVVLVALSTTLLACSLSFNTSPDDSTRPQSNANGGGGGAGGDTAIPVARIVEPITGSTVPANRPLDITVQTDSTATYFQLTASGRVASTKSLPKDQSGPTSAILSWTPAREGSYSLEVIAYNNLVPGPPAAILITVSGVASEAGTTSAGCSGRVLVSQLNFRDGPGTGNSQLGRFETGESVTVLGRNSDNSWFQVQRMNTQQVWVVNNPQWFQTEGQCGNLPVVP